MLRTPSAVLAVPLLAAACASRAPAEREALRLDVTFETDDGERVFAPSIVCFAGQRANVQVVKPYAYVSDYHVEVAQSSFLADPIVDRVDEGVFVEVRMDRAADGGVDLSYAVRRDAVERPVERLTTTLGAGTAPVTVETPRLRTSSADGVVRLTPGVDTRIAVLGDGTSPAGAAVAVVARVSAVAAVSDVAADDADPR